MNIITLDNASRLVSNIKNWVTANFTPSTNGGDRHKNNYR